MNKLALRFWSRLIQGAAADNAAPMTAALVAEALGPSALMAAPIACTLPSTPSLRDASVPVHRQHALGVVRHRMRARIEQGIEQRFRCVAHHHQLTYRIAQRFTLRAQSGLENSLDVIWTWRFQETPADAAMRKSTILPRARRGTADPP